MALAATSPAAKILSSTSSLLKSYSACSPSISSSSSSSSPSSSWSFPATISLAFSIIAAFSASDGVAEVSGFGNSDYRNAP
jgi:hypothetical protein